MMKKIISVVLIFATVISLFPSNVIATELFSSVNTNQNKTESVNYGAVIGNTAVFAGYFPTPISDMPEKVNNLWGTDSQFLFLEDVTSDMVFVITDYYLSPEGHLWYKLDAAPGSEMPERLKTFPWVYQVTVSNPFDATLIVHESGKNFIFDAEGNPVTEVTIGLYDKYEISCESSLLGVPEYRWQIFIAGEWVNIAGNATSSMSISRALLINALDSNNQTKVRCITKSGSKEVVGEPVIVRLDPNSNNLFEVPTKNEEVTERMVEVSPVNMKASAVAEGFDVCYVTVQFLFENGTQAANSFVAQVPVGQESNIAVEFPYVLGYEPYYDGERLDQTVIAGIFNENEIFEVIYLPTNVKYTVDIYFQNVENDNYTFHTSIVREGLTGTLVPATTEVFPGMEELLHETPVIAADGSTHVEVYYDRNYYMTRVDLDEGFGVYSVFARYGTNLPNHLTAPTKPGYTFIGWDEYTVDSDGDKIPDSGADGIANTVHPTVPAHHLGYVALWKKDTTAKVSIVFWGQNPNKEGDPKVKANYDYLETIVREVKPGAQLTYSLSGGYICGVDAHKHGAGCAYICGKEEHTHTHPCYELICQEKEHTHEDKCYGACVHEIHDLACYVSAQNADRIINSTNGMSYTVSSVLNALKEDVATAQEGTVYRCRYNRGEYYNFFYVKETWYYLGTKNDYKGVKFENNRNPADPANGSYNSNKAKVEKCSHTHDDNCANCGQQVHTHTDYAVKDGCYKLVCTDGHAHTGTCYSCTEHTHSNETCGYPAFTGYSSTLWTFAYSETVTVEQDGTTVLNVYFNRTKFTLQFRTGDNTTSKIYEITEPWGADITEHWPIKGTDGKTYSDGQRWTPKNSNTFKQVLVYIAVMPQESFWLQLSTSNANTFIMHYMAEVLPGQSTTGARVFDGKYFVELFEPVKANYNHLTKAEDFLKLEGYVQYGAEPGFNSENTMDKDGGGDVYFYYTRLQSTLELYSGTKATTYIMSYGESLSEYLDYDPPLPPEYEPNSHYFVGWYLNPECSGDPVDLNTMTMPAGAFALYSKWEKKEHNVSVVLNKKDDGIYTEADYVIGRDGKPINSMKVLHGTTVYDDKSQIPGDPTNGLYKFLGWFYMEDGDELMWDFTNQPVVGDLIIYAKWSSEVMVPYTIYYKDTEGNEIAPAESKSALAGHSVTVKAKAGKELYEEYRNKYFPKVVSHSIALDINNAETGVEYTFVYERAETKKYYIHYVDADNNNAELTGSPIEKESEYAVITETYKTFTGYVPDAYQKTLVLSADEKENHLYFYYTKANDKGVWFVGHYVQDKDDLTQYNTHSEKGDVDKIGTEISVEWPVDLSIDGFKFEKAVITKGKNITTVTTMSQINETIVEEGVKIEVYYTRILYPYKIVYRNKDTGTEILATVIGSSEQPYGKTVTVSSVPTIAGYTYASSSSCTIVKDGNTVDTITKNVIYVYYTEQSIAINFVAVGPTGCGKVNPEQLNLKYESDKTASAVAQPAQNYKFVGWYYDAACTNPIITTDKLVPSGVNLILYKGSAWEARTYYAKFEADVMDLAIERTNGEAGQVYVYEVKNQSTGDIIYVTITGNDKVTIKDLVVGTYVITQQNGWSWRQGDPSQTVEHNEANRGKPVVFSASATNNKWLNGNSANNKNKRGN